MSDETYFAQWSRALRSCHVGVPTACIDLARVRANAARVKAHAGAKRIRISDKSVPSIAMLRFLRAELNTHRHMVFHLPFVEQTLRAFDDAEVLVGKPMPTFALAHALERTHNIGDWCARTIVLADSVARVTELEALARSRSIALRVALEIDVGLHRGGLTHEAFVAVLPSFGAHLSLAGLMGYDAHVGKSLKSASSSHASVVREYAAFVAQLRGLGAWHEGLILNGAGSPTFHRHDSTSPLTEMSVGSIFLKPTDYDLAALCEYEPAAFVAAPVLKVQDSLSVPDHPMISAFVSGASSLLGGSLSKTIFHYGGRWDAKPVFPPGLREHPAFAGSFNQGGLSAPGDCALKVDDSIFWRPMQTESVLLRFGAWLVRDGDRIERWQPLAEPYDPAQE
jgi:D-serine deaminase-like pyridoxal phosphate-dependent protein